MAKYWFCLSLWRSHSHKYNVLFVLQWCAWTFWEVADEFLKRTPSPNFIVYSPHSRVSILHQMKCHVRTHTHTHTLIPHMYAWAHIHAFKSPVCLRWFVIYWIWVVFICWVDFLACQSMKSSIINGFLLWFTGETLFHLWFPSYFLFYFNFEEATSFLDEHPDHIYAVTHMHTWDVRWCDLD